MSDELIPLLPPSSSTLSSLHLHLHRWTFQDRRHPVPPRVDLYTHTHTHLVSSFWIPLSPPPPKSSSEPHT